MASFRGRMFGISGVSSPQRPPLFHLFHLWNSGTKWNIATVPLTALMAMASEGCETTRFQRVVDSRG
ncbi:MAG: hypothetical protein ACI4A8_09875 [Muribaculaceae bacterium]